MMLKFSTFTVCNKIESQYFLQTNFMQKYFLRIISSIWYYYIRNFFSLMSYYSKSCVQRSFWYSNLLTYIKVTSLLYEFSVCLKVIYLNFRRSVFDILVTKVRKFPVLAIHFERKLKKSMKVLFSFFNSIKKIIDFKSIQKTLFETDA